MKRIWGNIFRTAAALGLCLGACSADAARLVLTNGDVLSGTLVSVTKTHYTLLHPVLGEVKIDAKRVKVVEADLPKQADNAAPDAAPTATQTKKPAPAAKPKQGDAKAKAKAKQAAKDDDADGLAGFFKTWDSKVALGLNGAAGNTDRQNYYAKFDTKSEDGRHRWLFNSRWFYAEANGNQTQNQFESNLTKDWLKKDSDWFFFVKGQYKYDANRSWENRTSGFGGGGYTLIKDEKVEVNTRLGFGGTYEFGDINEFTPEALFGGSVLKWEVTERAALVGETIYFPALDDSGDFRIESKLEWTYKLDLAKGLSLKLGLENEYDSRTPNDNGNNDLKYYGALVVSF